MASLRAERTLPLASSRTLAAYERLRAEIITGHRRPDSRLAIADLAGSFDVSPGAVREALSRLASDGLAVLLPQRGFRVAPVSLADLRDLTEARVEIESACLRRAMMARSVAWEAGLVAAAHVLAHTPFPQGRSAEDERWFAAHAEFHRALLAACDNGWLLRLRDGLHVQSERYRRLSLAGGFLRRDVAGEHAELLDAVLKNEADIAVGRLADHFRETSRILEEKIAAGL